MGRDRDIGRPGRCRANRRAGHRIGEDRRLRPLRPSFHRDERRAAGTRCSGSAKQCGWLTDRFGLSWQIVPSILGDMMSDPDPAKAKRASNATLKRVKNDIAALKAAYSGTKQ
jgi:hypothetical protein